MSRSFEGFSRFLGSWIAWSTTIDEADSQPTDIYYAADPMQLEDSEKFLFYRLPERSPTPIKQNQYDEDCFWNSLVDCLHFLHGFKYIQNIYLYFLLKK
jgi:hypothetical protein